MRSGLAVLLFAAGQTLPCDAQPPSPERSGADAPPILRLGDGGPSLAELLALPDWASLELVSVAQPFVNPIGGLTRKGAWMQQTNLTASIGSGLGTAEATWREVDHWSIELNLALLNGNPNYGAQLGAVFSPQELADPVGLWPAGLTISRDPGDGWWGIEAGLLPIEPDFLTAPIQGFYVSALVSTAPAITIPAFPITPAAAPAGVLTLRPSPSTSLSIGSFDLAATASVSNALGVNSRIPTGSGWTHLAQLRFQPAWLHQQSAGPIRACGQGAGGWNRGDGLCKHPVLVERQLPAGEFLLAGFAGPGPNRGLFAHATLPVPIPHGLDHRFWVSAAYGADPSANPNPSYVGGGLISQGLIPGRPFDLMAVGIARSGFSPVLTPGRSYEGAVELGYQIRINQALSLQPTWVWILRPGGSGAVPGIGALGLQISWGF